MAGKLDLAGSQLISVETNLVDLLWTADRYFKRKKHLKDYPQRIRLLRRLYNTVVLSSLKHAWFTTDKNCQTILVIPLEYFVYSEKSNLTF